jgi:hypothetical protein
VTVKAFYSFVLPISQTSLIAFRNLRVRSLMYFPCSHFPLFLTSLCQLSLNMKLSALPVSLCVSRALEAPKHLDSRDGCPSDYTVCSPSGAMTVKVPRIGDSAMQNLFVDLVGSSLPDGNKAALRSMHDIQPSASLCCVASLSCLTMSSLLIPFCYDRYTTDYFLPDGSYGTVVGGTYKTASGDVANLLSGDYMLKNGMSGNIYANNESAKPNTATLHLPAQFTGQGVGSAIPPSALGAVVTVTYTTVLLGTTILPNTVVASTRSAQVVDGSVQPVTTQTSTLAGSTIVSVEMATTETTLLASSTVIRTIPETTLSTTFADSTAVSVIQETSVPVSTIPAVTIGASTIPGTTVDPITATLTTMVPAGQSTGIVSSDSRVATVAANTTQSRASSFDPLWAWQTLMIILIARFGL